MDPIKAYDKKLLTSYFLIGLGLLALSCLGLIWNDWEIIVAVASGYVLGGVNFFFLLKSSTAVNLINNTGHGTAAFMGLTGLRSLLALIAILIPTLAIYFTGTADSSSLRYLNILGAGLPFIVTALISVGVKYPEKEPVKVQAQPAVKAEENKKATIEKKPEETEKKEETK